MGESQPSGQFCRLPSAPPNSNPTRALSRPGCREPLRFLSATAQPPNLPMKPAGLPASPNPAPSAPALTVTRASHRREAKGAPRPHANRFPKCPALVTSAARQRGVFLSYSGFQLGGPEELLSITQSPPQASARLTNQRLSPGRRRVQSPERKAMVPPHAPAAASRSQCAHARASARCRRFLSDLALWPHCCASGSSL